METLDTVSRIYCGRRIPDSLDTVTDEDIAAFERDVVARYCPDGWTQLSAQGGWRDMATGATIREPSVVWEIAHGAGGKARIAKIARAWKQRYRQDAVMVASTPLAVRFI